MAAARQCLGARCERWQADPATSAIDRRPARAMAQRVAFKPVFEFYAGVLGRDGVRRKMVARLGRRPATSSTSS